MDSTGDGRTRRGRSAKAPLSRQAILDAAKELVRDHGVDELTLRRVADRVETGPASLYAYFANRDVLLEHLLDAAYSEVELVEIAGDGWKHALAATIGNTIDALGRYPGLGAVALGTIPTLPGALRLAEHELALMDAGGVSDERAALAVDLIAQFAASTAVERAVRHEDSRGAAQRGRVRAAYQQADSERFPRVARSAALLTGPGEEARRAFAIDLIVNGIERSE
ncbi:AcrR family transcriptional regulator [Microbacterium sp. SORGH_AS428]|uniref:TetR family transcriptional regulator n=1 Tax=Microbacterium sp. SORGH_AS_0428 TaxID=3041788 RepID=UPI00285643BE|nr:TetR/AcrR family transcriptional regulator C-terminal domain-containing protein [Microbacterium sp. SORGH_AS_0428]MDR6200766.1 AcrR family transcriptional regulator [Microbacterium sp. SORGH_AS_0428]